MAKQIPEEIIEEVKRANDIVDVVGEYVQLKKQGKNFFGLCPFHGEKTPSFSVTQEKQIFHCFGCGKGGNVFAFMMEMEGFSFQEAVRFLAERGGISLPDFGRTSSSGNGVNDHVLSAYNWLTKLYNHLLKFTKEGRDGYNYLKNRGILEETMDEFQLGFAPNLENFTAEFLKKKGFDEQMLVKAGLLLRRDDNSVTDRFKGRVVFPIRNHIGKTIGFGGRALNDQQPKYLNSAESELFQKSKLLYNFDLAKKHIRKQNEVILFEGYMDVIAAYQAGIKNVVATLGTALTDVQAKLLKRYVDTVIICYDGDNAGMEASYKAANLLRQAGFTDVKVAKLENGLDPDTYIKTYGGSAFENEIIKASDTYMSFYMRYAKNDYNLSIEGDRLQYIEDILEELAKIESSVEREYYLKEISQEFDFTLETLSDELQKHITKQGRRKDKSREKSHIGNKISYYPNKKILPAYQNAERSLLGYMLSDVSIAIKVQEEIGASFNVDAHKIIATHLYAFYEEGHEPDVSLFIEQINDPELRKLVTEIAMLPLLDEVSETAINDYIRMIQSRWTHMDQIESLKRQLKLAEQRNDPIKAAEIGMKIIEINKQLKYTN